MDGWMDGWMRRGGASARGAFRSTRAAARQPAEIFTSGLRRILSWS